MKIEMLFGEIIRAQVGNPTPKVQVEEAGGCRPRAAGASPALAAGAGQGGGCTPQPGRSRFLWLLPAGGAGWDPAAAALQGLTSFPEPGPLAGDSGSGSGSVQSPAKWRSRRAPCPRPGPEQLPPTPPRPRPEGAPGSSMKILGHLLHKGSHMLQCLCGRRLRSSKSTGGRRRRFPALPGGPGVPGVPGCRPGASAAPPLSAVLTRAAVRGAERGSVRGEGAPASPPRWKLSSRPLRARLPSLPLPLSSFYFKSRFSGASLLSLNSLLEIVPAASSQGGGDRARCSPLH